MKNQFLGTFFYMLYMLAMIQPIMPLIEYQVNKDFIASVLCENRNKPEIACNGKCFLAKEVKDSHQENSHQHTPPQIDLSKYPVSLIESESNQPKDLRIGLQSKFVEIAEQTRRYSNSIFRPPIV